MEEVPRNETNLICLRRPQLQVAHGVVRVLGRSDPERSRANNGAPTPGRRCLDTARDQGQQGSQGTQPLSLPHLSNHEMNAQLRARLLGD